MFFGCVVSTVLFAVILVASAAAKLTKASRAVEMLDEAGVPRS